jgi:hypothetical protein
MKASVPLVNSLPSSSATRRPWRRWPPRRPATILRLPPARCDLIVFAHVLALLFDLFGLLLIDPRQFVASLAQGVENLVELRMNGLGVTMFSALYDERHEPRRQSSYGVPVQR